MIPRFFSSAMPFLLPLLALSAPSSTAQRPLGSLSAGPLTIQVGLNHDHLDGFRLHDSVSGKSFTIPEAFVLSLKDGKVLRASELTAVAMAEPAMVNDPHDSLRSQPQSGDVSSRSCWNFSSPQTDAAVQWCVVVKPGTDYLRELLHITAGASDLPIAEVRMLDFHDPEAHVDGVVKGSPIVDQNLFFGFEHPLSSSTVQNGEVRASLFRDLPLRTGQSITYSAVLGSAARGQLRRAFLNYIESERPRPYQPFLHYNTWFDLGYGNRYDEAGVLDRINAIGRQLVVDRHVQLDSFLFDDGWDNTHSLWQFNSGFPGGLAGAAGAAAKFRAGIGLWFSPWGGYDEDKTQRIAYGEAHGYETLNGGYALSGPKYFARFEAICLQMVDQYNVNQFKFDGTGNADRVFPGSAFDSDFDAAIQLIERLRREKPDLFINLTTGTTASPFWLFYADSIWRGGDDHAFSGVGDARQRWITYRDAQTYKNIVLRGPLFPLNSLMLHGIIYARQATDLESDPNNDFADEVHSYFGSGTQLQELYITPSLLTPQNWDTLATAARWSRSRSETLKDVHWIGGDPDHLQIYGWAGWSPQRGILTLRNPSNKPQSFTIDAAEVFQLPKGAVAGFTLRSVWDDPRHPLAAWPKKLDEGSRSSIQLAPFQVITLEATPGR